MTKQSFLGMFLILSASIFLIVGCANDSVQELSIEPHPEVLDDHTIVDIANIEIQPYSFTYQEQEFEIIPFYNELLEYVALARTDQDRSLEKLFSETVTVPLNTNLGWSFSYPSLLRATSELDKLENYTHQLILYSEKINEIIVDALKKSADILSGENKKKVFLFPFHPEEEDTSRLMKGVGGFGYIDSILLFIHPFHFSDELLSYTLSHEYHHTAYFESFRPTPTLLDSIIREGQADTFAEIVHPEIKAPWTEPLTKKQEKHVWEIMSELLDQSRTMVDLRVNFLMGNYSLGIPYWSDYKIGYQIMQDFIHNNPDVSIEEWTKMKADEILELSKFEDRFGK